jgi:hypothetical protein
MTIAAPATMNRGDQPIKHPGKPQTFFKISIPEPDSVPDAPTCAYLIRRMERQPRHRAGRSGLMGAPCMARVDRVL